MHGRIKVKTTAQQEEQKRKEREKKLHLFQKASSLVLEKNQNEEYDAAGLVATQQILSANSDYSSMWNYRKNAFLYMKSSISEDEMKTTFMEELEFLTSCLRNNPKSYGCWHHRCFVMLNMPQPDWKKELNLCNQFLQFDDRNFHCWDYRRFVVKHSDPVVSVEDEIKCTDKLVQSNFSNYSSWHYRSKLLPLRYQCPNNANHIEESKLLEELELVQNAFFTDPNDQSAWFYHRWLLGRGTVAQGLIAVHAKETPCNVLCIFRKQISLDEVKARVCVLADDVKQEGAWHSPVGSGYQHMWIFIPSAELNASKLIITYSDQVIALQFEKGIPETFFQCDVKEDFQQELSAAKMELLQSELDSCVELNDLEPGNKWVVLTLVLLLRAIDPSRFQSQTNKYITGLKSIDATRSEYYSDLQSKFSIEDHLATAFDAKSVNLCSRGLTRVCDLQYFSLVTHFDISRNSLKTLVGPFHLLRCCEVFIADENVIVDISGIQFMPKLKTLSLAKNLLGSAKVLPPLETCPNLRDFNLQHNDFCTDEILSITEKFENVRITSFP